MNNLSSEGYLLDIGMYPLKCLYEQTYPFGVYLVNLEIHTQIHTPKGFTLCQPGYLYFIEAFVPFSIHCNENVGRLLIFHAPKTDVIPQNMNHHGVAKVVDAVQLGETIYHLLSRITPDNIHYTRIVQDLTQAIHDYFMSHDEAIACKNIISAKLRKAHHYIYQNLDKPIKIQDICDYIHLSPSYLTHQFQAVFEETPTQYIQRAKIKKAKHTLQHQYVSLSEVAASVGFKDVSWFIKLFQKYEGMHPKQVLKSISYLDDFQ